MKLLVLAPIAGFTSSPFRKIVRKIGAHWTWTELISASMIIKRGLSSPLLYFTPEERPIRIQLYGSDPEVLFKAGQIIMENLAPEGLDLNAGCPARKVVQTGAGAALLKDRSLLKECAQAISQVCKNHGISSSVKFRLGFVKDELEKIAHTLLEAKIKVLVLHARTAQESFSSPAHWKRIKDLKKIVGPQALVIGNGDIKTWQDIYKMFVTTQCDGVMIGRAALERPWIFKEAKERKILEISLYDRILLLEELVENFIKSPQNPLKGVKNFIPKILKGVKGKRKIVPWLLEARTIEALRERLLFLKNETRNFTTNRYT